MPGGNTVWCAAGLLAASPGSHEAPAACGGLTPAPRRPASGLQRRKCAISPFPVCIRPVRVLKVNTAPRDSVGTADQELMGNACSQVPQAARVPVTPANLSPDGNAPSCQSSSRPIMVLRVGSCREGEARKGQGLVPGHVQAWVRPGHSQPSWPRSRPLPTPALGQTWLRPRGSCARTSEPARGWASAWGQPPRGDSGPGAWTPEPHRQRCVRGVRASCTVRTVQAQRGAGLCPQSHSTRAR